MLDFVLILAFFYWQKRWGTVEMDSGEFGRVAFGGEGEHYAHESKTRNTHEGIHQQGLNPGLVRVREERTGKKTRTAHRRTRTLN